MLQPGRLSSIEWSHGSVGVAASSDCVSLIYRHRVVGEPWRQAREVVRFTYTQTCFGGRRRWFECPGCGKACRVLFGSPFRCRACHGLRYSSQYQSAVNTAIGRLQALRARLGGSGDHTGPFPPRPKHMQSKTYMRLRERDQQLWRRTTLGFASDLERLRRRIAT
jgi:hypothetical protein